ncbi:MAG: hypothetical protein COT38_05830, partial [Candidatus Omnitrophica bacterium CG08_land_8_20_14_0_20_41_16]
ELLKFLPTRKNLVLLKNIGLDEFSDSPTSPIFTIFNKKRRLYFNNKTETPPPQQKIPLFSGAFT